MGSVHSGTAVVPRPGITTVVAVNPAKLWPAFRAAVSCVGQVADGVRGNRAERVGGDADTAVAVDDRNLESLQCGKQDAGGRSDAKAQELLTVCRIAPSSTCAFASVKTTTSPLDRATRPGADW